MNDQSLDAIRYRHNQAIEYAKRGGRMTQSELDVDSLLGHLGTLNRRLDQTPKQEMTNVNNPDVVVQQIFKDLSSVIDPNERKIVLRNWVISIIAHAKMDQYKNADKADHTILRHRVERIEHYLDEIDPAWLLKSLPKIGQIDK